MKLLKKIDKLLSHISIFFIKIYQYTLSPDKGIPSLWLKWRVCVHEPHCSEYSVRTFKRYGFIKGIFKVTDRVLHCTWGMNKIYDPEHYKVVFFSSAPIGVPFLQELEKDNRFEVIWVVTTPDKPVGRGLKVQPNIIKTTAEEIDKKSKNIRWVSKIILLHGKDTNSKEKRYPWVKEQLEFNWLEVFCPDLPNSKDPNINEWLNEIDKLSPDENTIIIWHSRWWVAALRRLEKNNQKIKKTILVAANDWKSKYISHWENNKGFYTENGYNFNKIKGNCNEFVIFHSKDDQWVSYEYGINNKEWLDAKLYSFEDKNHFGWNEKYNYRSKTMPQLVNEILYNDAFGNLIQTPNSLRLDSKKYAEEAHNFYLWLKEKNPDYIVVIAYGKIIPENILNLPKVWPINVHGSILPEYRGASPLQSVFLDGKKETGITIMEMAPTLDTGDMIDVLKFPLKFDRTVKDLIEEMQEKGPKFLNSVLWKYGKRMLGKVKQNNDLATECGKIEKEDGEIDPNKDNLEDIYKKYRAFYLWPKIYWINEWKRIIVEELRLDEKLFEENKDKPILDWDILNKCIIEIKVKPEWKKSMSWNDFLKWHKH